VIAAVFNIRVDQRWGVSRESSYLASCRSLNSNSVSHSNRNSPDLVTPVNATLSRKGGGLIFRQPLSNCSSAAYFLF